MSVPLAKHYPADETFHDGAIERLVDGMDRDDWIELYDELARGVNSLLAVIGTPKVIDYELTTLKRRFQQFAKSYDREIAEGRRLDNARLTP